MTYDDRPVSEGPARDDPELGDPLAPRVAGEGAGDSTGEGVGDRAREVASTAAERAGDVASTGREQARDVASSASERAGEVAATASAEAREVARSTGDQARRLASDARQELRQQAEAQAERLADGLDDLTRQLRSMGERGEPGPATDLVRQAGERAEEIADRLRRGGVDDAVGQLRDLGRNRPGLFLLGAFGLGLASGRLARNLAQDPTAGGDGSRSAPAVPRQANATRPAIGPDAGVRDYAVPAGHVAYGAPADPFGDEQGRR
jgi:vacuolar-type H+-ATPase subunit H